MRILILVVTLIAAVAGSYSHTVSAQERKRTPALREQVYSQLARAQELADQGDVNAGLNALSNVESKLSSMNSYERAMLWNFYGYMYYGQDQVDRAIDYFSKVVAEEAIPESLLQNTLFSLAQLTLGEERYQDTLNFLDQWQKNAAGDQIKAQVLRAQALYQMQQYEPALVSISAAIDSAEQSGHAEENWYILQRAIYFELGNIEQVAVVLETMVRQFNKPEYWLQLAGVYGQLGQDQKHMAMLEAAFQQGFLSSGQDLMKLAQSYFFNDVPYKAGQVLAEGLASGAIAANERNLKMLAQSWVAARETERALAALEQAAQVTDNGELDAQRAQLLLNAERPAEAVIAAQLALTKGGLEKPGNMHLVIGMAELNQENFNAALAAFAAAKEFTEARQAARQWERYASAEQQQSQRLSELRNSAS